MKNQAASMLLNVKTKKIFKFSLKYFILLMFVLNSMESAFSQTLSTNLIAFYKLENVNDNVGSYTLTNVGSTPFNAAKFNNGGDLGASNSTKYFYRDDSYGLTYASSRSFGFWFKLTTPPANGTGITLARFLFTGGSANYTDIGYSQSGGVYKIFSASTPAGVQINYTLNVGEWYYIAVTHDHGGNIRRIYVNGTEIGSEASWTSSYSLTTRLTIGADHGFGSQASGIFDEFGLWGRILTPAEITSLYNNGQGFQYPFAVAPSTLYAGYPSAQSGSANPTNFAYSTPFFSAINNNGESINKYRIQLTQSSDAGFASPVWDSGSGGISITSTNNGSRTPDIFYGGSTLLTQGTNYIWRIQFYGTSWGPWSTVSASIGMTTGDLTARFNVGAGDGEIQYSNSNGISNSEWNIAHDATSGNGLNYTDASSSTYYHPGQWGNGSVFQIMRAYEPVNTSALGASTNISTATFNLYITDHYSASVPGGAPMYFRLVQSTQNDPAVLTLADYGRCGATDNPTALAPDFQNNSINDNQYNSWTLNSTGLSTINKTGWTKFGIRYGSDVQDYPYQSFWVTRLIVHNSEQGLSSCPYLSVTYSALVVPTITTQTVTSINGTTATGNGNVSADGGATITERGVCWNTSTSPTTSNNKATSAGTTGAFTTSITGLTSGTLYYVRAYAINSVGISYGNELTFSTPAPATVDWNYSNVQEITLSANRTFTFINGKSGGLYTLFINQNATGGWVVTWPANVKWSGGVAPTLTNTANAVDLLKFAYNGTNYIGYAPVLDAK